MTKKNTQSIGNPLPLRIIRSTFPVIEKAMPRVAHKLAYNLFFIPVKYKRPKRELPILDWAEMYNEEINGKSTRFYSWGNPEHPRVVLVHGWMGRASQFFKLINVLVERQYHVVAFDGPAHGDSGGKKTNVLDFAEAILRIERKYGKITVAVGHSFGGITILQAIKKGLDLNDVIFLSTPSIADDIVEQFEEKINASPAVGDYFRKRVIKKYGISFESISAGETIKEIELNSLLLIHDEQDKDVAIDHALLMKKRFPAAETMFTKGLGHTRILRNDEVVAKILHKADQLRKK